MARESLIEEEKAQFTYVAVRITKLSRIGEKGMKLQGGVDRGHGGNSHADQLGKIKSAC